MCLRIFFFYIFINICTIILHSIQRQLFNRVLGSRHIYTVRYTRPFEGNHDADVARDGNEFYGPALKEDSGIVLSQVHAWVLEKDWIHDA